MDKKILFFHIKLVCFIFSSTHLTKKKKICDKFGEKKNQFEIEKLLLPLCDDEMSYHYDENEENKNIMSKMCEKNIC